MSGGFRVQDLSSEAQALVAQYGLDSGPGGMPNQQIDAYDDLVIMVAMGRVLLEEGPGPKLELLGSIKRTRSNPLEVPRYAETAGRIGGAMQAPKAYVGAAALDRDTLRAMSVSERIALMTAIMDKKGYGGFFGWFTGRIDGNKERVLLAIIESTPEHQFQTLVGEMAKSGLDRRMDRAMDFSNKIRFRELVPTVRA